MAKLSDLNASQVKLLQIIERAIKTAETNPRKPDEFDFPCPNNDCSGKNGKREVGIAWKNKRGGYSVFCYTCGQDDSFEKDDFKSLKKLFQAEENKNKNETKSVYEGCHPGDPGYYEEEYLDDDKW